MIEAQRDQIRENRFVNCGDEGIDLSDNDEVHVHDNVILDRRGGHIGADRHLDEIRANNTLGYTDSESGGTR